MVARLIGTSCDEGKKVLLLGSCHCKAVGSSSVCSCGSGITASVTHTSGKVSVRIEAHRPWNSLSMRGVRHGRGRQCGVSGLRCIVDERAVCCLAGNSIGGGASGPQSVWFGNLGSGPAFWDVGLEQVVEVDDFLRFFEEGPKSEHVPCFFAEVMEDCIDFVSIDSWVFKWKDTLQDKVLVRLGPRLKIEFIVAFPGGQQVVEFWGLPPLIPLLQYVNRLGFEICSVNRMNNRTRKLGHREFGTNRWKFLLKAKHFIF